MLRRCEPYGCDNARSALTKHRFDGRSERFGATRAYIERRIAGGKTPREAKRCLKRYIARHIYRILENPSERV